MYVSSLKGYAAAAFAVFLVFGSCMPFFMPDAAASDDEPPCVTGDFTVEIDGEEAGAFEYLGIIYVETGGDESAAEVGVYGTSETTSIDGHYVCVNSFEYGEDDDAVSYAVTSVLQVFKDNAPGVTGDCLILAASITDYAEGCFEGLGLTGLTVGNGVTGEMMEKAGLGPSDYRILDEDLPADYVMNVSAGDINGNVVDVYNGGERLVELGAYSGITTVAVCPFENPGFEATCFADSDGNEIPVGAQAFLIGGALYIDGEPYDGSADVESQWEEDRSYLADYEIEIALPFLHICTVTGTYEMWMMGVTSGIIVILAVIGLSMFGYRMAAARKG